MEKYQYESNSWPSYLQHEENRCEASSVNQECSMPVNQQCCPPVNQQCCPPVNQQCCPPVNQQCCPPVNQPDCQCIQIGKCELDKNVCVEYELSEGIKILSVKVLFKNLCPNRTVTYVVQILSCKNNKVLMQMGDTFYTGHLTSPSNQICQKQNFVLPADLCRKNDNLYVNIISNYWAEDSDNCSFVCDANPHC